MSKTAVKTKKAFTQLCVWESTIVGEAEKQDFVDWMQKEHGVRVKYHCEVETLPDVKNGKAVEGTGGRNDLFFYIHQEDISKFAVKSKMMGMRWWEDVLGNGGGKLYTDEFLEANPKTW